MNNTFAEGLAQDQVDSALRAYFQREMPSPWPPPRVVPPADRRHAWFRVLFRPALVASVALFVTGYVMLAAMFPVSSEPGLHMNRDRTIGSKAGPKGAVAPRPGDALLWEERGPSGRVNRPPAPNTIHK